MDATVAYLAKGKLFVRTGDAEPRPLQSRFAESVRERAVRSAQRHSWKYEGRGARFMGMGALTWGLPKPDPAALPVAFTGLTRAREPNRLIYSLETDAITGLFAVDAATGEEQRLQHGNDQRIEHPSARAGVDLVACAVQHPGGTANLAVMRADGSDLLEVTEGDSVDLAPSWVPNQPQLVYQSAGVGRDRAGNFLALGPFAIQRVDLKSGELLTLAEDPAADLLGPRIGGDGTLYYIRRPHHSASRVAPWRLALGVLMIPVHLVVALWMWLSFFVMRYTGKPLAPSGDARQRSADLKQMMVWGNLVDAEQAARKARLAGDDAPALVPASWQLMRRRPDAEPEALAKGVLSFDLRDDGTVVWSNGSGVWQLDPAGTQRRLFKDERIEQVVMLG